MRSNVSSALWTCVAPSQLGDLPEQNCVTARR